MSIHPHVKGMPSELRAETAILAAVAREALLECHVRHVVKLIELGRGRVAPERMIEIYARLHYLEVDMLADVRGRALAALGERVLRYAVLTPVEDSRDEKYPQPPHTGVWSRIRSIFRGRIHHSLRHEVDRHTGKTEIALMEVHTEQALRFARAVERHFALQRAVRMYAETVGLRESLRETLYLLVLSRVGDATPDTPVLGFMEAPTGIAANV